MNFGLFVTRQRNILCKSLHLSRTTISKIIVTRQNLNLRCRRRSPLDFRTLYNCFNVPTRIKQPVGKLWNSKLIVISFPPEEKNESPKAISNE